MKTNFILNEGDKKRILELHKRATKNHYISKNILSEGKADVVKNKCSLCNSISDTSQNRKYNKNQLYTVVDLFKKAYDSSLGTDMTSFRDGLKYIEKFTLSDFCAFIELYEGQTGESWYEATDSDIDYDSEWDEIIVALRDIEERQANTTTNMASSQQQGGNFDNLFSYISGVLKDKGWTLGNSKNGVILYSGPWVIYKDITKNPFPITKFENNKYTEKYKLKTIGKTIDDTLLQDVYDNEVKMADLIKKFAPSANNTSQVKNQVYKKVQTKIKQPNYSLLN